jgi:hypothetical protein
MLYRPAADRIVKLTPPYPKENFTGEVLKKCYEKMKYTFSVFCCGRHIP